MKACWVLLATIVGCAGDAPVEDEAVDENVEEEIVLVDLTMPEYPAADPPEPGESAVSAPSAPCPPPPKAGPYPNLGGTPGSYSGKCCGSPAPFPGLSCCDSRDCGWFKCDDQAMRMKTKRPGRVK